MRMWLLVLWILSFSRAQALHVLIDPGHGGDDHGARTSEAREAEITLKIAKQLTKILDKQELIRYSITRRYDTSVELQKRSELAHAAGADIYVSIHANASLNPRARGPEIYIQNVLPSDQYSFFLASRENNEEISQRGTRPSFLNDSRYSSDIIGIVDDIQRHYYIEKSYELARVFEQRWKQDLGHKRVRMRQAPFFVVSAVNMPSLLLEVGYLTNPQEAKQLRSLWYQKKIAQSIYAALLDYQALLRPSAINN